MRNEFFFHVDTSTTKQLLLKNDLKLSVQYAYSLELLKALNGQRDKTTLTKANRPHYYQT